MIEQLLIITAIGTILSIDVTLAGQFLLSRPIVVLTIIGFYIGDPVTGFVLGVFLELLSSDMLPLGVSVPLDTAVMATVAAAAYFLGDLHNGLKIKSAALLLGMIAGVLFRKYDLWFKKKASGIFNHLREYSQEIDKTIELAIIFNIALTLIRNFVFMFVFAAAAIFVKDLLFSGASQELLKSFYYFDRILPYLSIAVMLSAVKHKRFGA
jgi:mannose/fructose/N-acetylgalactosamine-specific phosphotransferase system component IIC